MTGGESRVAFARASAGRVARTFRLILVWPLRLYHVFVSPLLGPSCRFEPSCSVYAHDAILRWGALRGVSLALWRLARCQPWTAGGDDPVPVR